MEIKPLFGKLKELLFKYKYALIVLLVGLSLLMIPEKRETAVKPTTVPSVENYKIDAQALSEILQSMEGAGRVEVLLSLASGEKKLYQVNQDTSSSEENNSTKVETVIITDSQRNESGLITRTDSPIYRGAIVVCQGADSPAVRLSITQAVSRITGLGADNICVLKMK